jgi:menaquinone-dependent protoporphyrinogen oxidase
MARILVLYGTTERHTGKIAAAVGNALSARGFAVDIVEAGTQDPNASQYDGILVAASIHAGRYQKAVGKWIRAHRAEFGARPTAFISVCLAINSKRPGARAEIDAIIARFVKDVGWQPTVTKPVAGALLYTRYNFFIRWLMRRIAAKEGGDTDTSRDYEYTDWNDLREFADAFGRRLASAA